MRLLSIIIHTNSRWGKRNNRERTKQDQQHGNYSLLFISTVGLKKTQQLCHLFWTASDPQWRFQSRKCQWKNILDFTDKRSFPSQSAIVWLTGTSLYLSNIMTEATSCCSPLYQALSTCNEILPLKMVPLLFGYICWHLGLLPFK